MKRWRIWVPLLTWAAILVAFLAQRTFAPPPEELVIQPAPSARIPALELRERAHSLAGEVLDPSGSGVADALVWVRAGDAPHFTYTDASGRYRIDALEDGPWHVIALAHGFAPLVLDQAEATPSLTLRFGAPLGPAPSLPKLERAKLSGSVSSPLPADLDGAEVVLIPTAAPETLSAPLPRRARIGADGRFEFEDLILGEYQVEVRPAWARGGSWPDLARGLEVSGPRVFTHGTAGRGEISLELQVGDVSGRTLGPDGEAIEGALILVTTADDPSRVWPPESSRADGAFSVRGLPAGRYLVAVRAGSAAIQREILVKSGETTSLDPGPLEVRRPR